MLSLTIPFLLQIALLLAHLFSWWAIIHALLHKRDSRSALGWTMVAFFLPGLGALLYVLFGIGRAESRATRLMAELARQAPGYTFLHTAPNTPISVSPSALPQRYTRLEPIGRALTGRPLIGGNSLLPLHNGEEAYPAMLDAIHKARHHVFMETYIFKEGVIANRFCEAFTNAVTRGVDVRLLVDGIGSSKMYSWHQPWKKLSQQGVKVEEFLPPSLFPPNLSINLRNHRKVLVCDNLAFTGGMNIADYHLQKKHQYSVQDINILCAGPIAQMLHMGFLLDWGFTCRQFDELPSTNEELCGDSLCRLVLDGPGSASDPLHELLCGVIAGAEYRICVMTPYFLPTHELMACFKAAAQRGVHVEVLLPLENNLRYVHWACFHLLPTLLRAGVHVSFRPPPFAHTKLILIDDYYALFGSTNLDNRSLRLNYELMVEAFDTSFARTLYQHFEQARSISYPVTLEDLYQLSLPVRLRNAACWIFLPYL